MFEKLTELCDSFIRLGIPGNDCIVRHHGEIVYRHVNGYSDRANKIPVQGNERYYIFSCSKFITAVAAMQLWEQHKFKLDDVLSDYMPEFRNMTVRQPDGKIIPAKTPITIRNLFTMTAGFPYDLWSKPFKEAKQATNGKCPTRKIMEVIAQQPLVYEPGTQWLYSTAHDVLAAFTEVITGQPFDQYVKEHIFDVCKMKHSTFHLPESEKSTVSAMYEQVKDSGEIRQIETGNNFIIGSEYVSGGAGCVSTVDDFSLFLEGVRTPEMLLHPDTLRLMTTDMLTDRQFSYYKETQPGYGYGLGVRCPRDPADGITDFGWGGAAGAWSAVDLINDYTVFYVQHVMNPPNQKTRKLITGISRECLTGK